MPTDPAKLGALDTAYARNKDKPGIREAWQAIRNYVAYFGKWPDPEGRPEAMLLIEAAEAELPSAEISIAANAGRAREAAAPALSDDGWLEDERSTAKASLGLTQAQWLSGSSISVDDASRPAKNNALRGLPSQAAKAESDD